MQGVGYRTGWRVVRHPKDKANLYGAYYEGNDRATLVMLKNRNVGKTLHEQRFYAVSYDYEWVRVLVKNLNEQQEGNHG